MDVLVNIFEHVRKIIIQVAITRGIKDEKILDKIDFGNVILRPTESNVVKNINLIANDSEGQTNIIKDKNNDTDLIELANSEIIEIKDNLNQEIKKLKLLLIPKDKDDLRNAIIEIRAGTGGDEAALFAANLFNMYNRYASLNNWKFEIISVSEIGIGENWLQAH